MTESGRQGTSLPKDKEKSGSIRKFLKMVALTIEKVLNDTDIIFRGFFLLKQQTCMGNNLKYD